MTEQRLTLNVPDSVVPTSMNLGAAWDGTTYRGRGLCVNSAGRVWLDAAGSDPDESTFAALSNATDGQVLLQSIGGAVMCISKETNITCSNEDVFMAAGGGVKIIAGHGAPVLFGAGDDSLENVRPDETDPASDHAAAYTDHLDAVAKGWTIADTAVAGALTALDVGLLIAECCKASKGPSADLGMALLVSGSAANLAGGTVNICGMQGSDLPGLSLHAFSAINLGTTGFCSIYSGAGMLLFGLTTSGVGFLTAGVLGLVNAGLKSLLMTTIEGKTTELAATLDLELNARAGGWELSGPKLQIGSNAARPIPGDASYAETQLPTTTISLKALQSLAVSAGPSVGGIEIDSAGKTAYDGGEIDVSAGQTVAIRGPGYEVTVAIDGITIALKKTTKIALDTSSVIFDALGGHALKLDAKSIAIGGKTAGLTIDADGSVIWKAAQASFA